MPVLVEITRGGALVGSYRFYYMEFGLDFASMSEVFHPMYERTQDQLDDGKWECPRDPYQVRCYLLKYESSLFLFLFFCFSLSVSLYVSLSIYLALSICMCFSLYLKVSLFLLKYVSYIYVPTDFQIAER